MILQAILALGFVSVVLGDGCCTPKRWEGSEMIAGGYSRGFRKGSIAEAFAVSYDATSKKVAATGRVFAKKHEYEFKVIYDFNATTGYFIMPKKQKCKRFELKRKFHEACIPDEAKLVGSSFLGAGDNKLEVSAYAMRFKGKMADIGAIAMVTKDGCVPVSEDLSGRVKRTGFFENVNFIGITAGIKDPTVFSPPDYCDKEFVDMIDEEFYEKHSMLQFSHPGKSQLLQQFVESQMDSML